MSADIWYFYKNNVFLPQNMFANFVLFNQISNKMQQKKHIWHKICK